MMNINLDVFEWKMKTKHRHVCLKAAAFIWYMCGGASLLQMALYLYILLKTSAHSLCVIMVSINRDTHF